MNKFRVTPGAQIKARALLVGTDAIGTIDMVPDLNFNHIGVCVGAFRDRPYSHTMEACP